MADEQDSQAARGKGSLFRRLAVFPAALIGNGMVVFMLTRLARAGFPLTAASPAVTEGPVQAIGLFFGGVSFVAIGSAVAPTRKRRTGWILFFVYLVLILVIEMFRAPRDYEPLSHLVRLLLAASGALCGLLLTLWLTTQHSTKKLATGPLAGPQNPWSGV